MLEHFCDPTIFTLIKGSLVPLAMPGGALERKENLSNSLDELEIDRNREGIRFLPLGYIHEPIITMKWAAMKTVYGKKLEISHCFPVLSVKLQQTDS